MEKEKGFARQLLHAGVRPGSHMGAVSIAVYQVSVFHQTINEAQ